MCVTSKEYGGLHPPPTAHCHHYQCSYPGPDIDYHLQDDWEPQPKTDSPFQVVKLQLANQVGLDPVEMTPKVKM